MGLGHVGVGVTSTGGDDAFHVVAARARHLGADTVLAVHVAAVMDGVVVSGGAREGGAREGNGGE